MIKGHRIDKSWYIVRNNEYNCFGASLIKYALNKSSANDKKLKTNCLTRPNNCLH